MLFGDNLIWFLTVFIFFKTEFSGPKVWRVNQCAYHLCDSFDGLLPNASTARGNFLQDTIGSVFVLLMPSNILIGCVVVCSKESKGLLAVILNQNVENIVCKRVWPSLSFDSVSSDSNWMVLVQGSLSMNMADFSERFGSNFIASRFQISDLRAVDGALLS